MRQRVPDDDDDDNDGTTYTVTDAIEAYGFGRFHVYQTAACAATWFLLSFPYESLPWLLDTLDNDPSVSLTTNQSGMITMSAPLGATVAAVVFWSYALEVFGRSRTLVVSAWAVAVLFMASSWAPTWFVLFVARVGMGVFFIPCDTTPNLLFVETMPVEQRGRIKPLLHLAWQVGSAFCILISYLSAKDDWAALIFAMSVPTLITTVLITPWFLKFDSPPFLNVVGRDDDAKKSLDFIAHTNGVQPLPGKVQPARSTEGHDTTSLWSRLPDLLDRSLLKISLLLTLVWLLFPAAQNMTLVFLSPHLSANDLGEYKHAIYTGNPIGKALGTIISIFLIESIGRVRMAQVGTALATLACLGMYSAHSPLQMWIAWFLTSLFMEFVWVSLYAFPPELYPTTIRGTVVTWFLIVSHFSATLSGYVGNVLSDMDTVLPIAVSAGLFFASAVLVTPLLRYETAGHTLSVGARAFHTQFSP